MDADEIERIINEELNKINISEEDLENYEEEDLTLDLPEDDSDTETDGMPASVLTYFEAAKDRMSVFEKHIQEDQEESRDATWSGTSVTCHNEDLLRDLAVSADDDPIALKERIISELEEQLAQPTTLDQQVAVEDSATPQNERAASEPEGYLEPEQRLQLELEELERRLKEEERRRREMHEAERKQHLLTEKEEEERRRLRQKELEEELRKLDEETRFQSTEMEETEGLTEKKMELELASQQEVIRRLEEQMEDERRVFEEAQEEHRRRQLEKEQRAATEIQAAFRALITRRWTRPALNQRREEQRRREEEKRMEEKRRERQERLRQEREEEEKRREEEEARQREEQERRRASYEKAKQEERLRLERERRLEEERRRREEEDRKRKEAEEKKRQEKEEEERKLNEEKERQQKLEEQKKRKEEEVKQRQEEELKRKEEEDRKKREAEEQRRREQEEEERKRVEGEQKRLEEEMKRKEEERKQENEGKVKATEAKKSEATEGSRTLQEKNDGERETRKAQNTAEPGEHKTRDTDVKPVEQGTATRFDLGPDQTQESTIHHPCSTPPQSPHMETSGTIGYLDQSNPTESNALVGPNDGCTVGAVDAESVCLPDTAEQKRLAWMLSCIPWSKLSMQNRRKQPPGPQGKRRGHRRPPQPSLAPLSVDTVLLSGGWSSLSQVTTVTLEDLPGCSLSTLSACHQLQTLTLRRCGLTSLEGLSSCTQLRHIDAQENSISYVDCRELARLQVLRLGSNQLPSIHGLDGAADLVELQLSHNRISRLGGLEALKKLQSLRIDHNQLTSTRGLTEAFTLQHLDLSHNHVTRAEGLDNCALLRTLRLAGNTLIEAPCLRNHVLLGELSLEDNSISCLEGLASCWLPLLHSLNVAQNSLTQLPALSDFISLMALDVSHNCLSELQSICESVQRCSHLQQLKLTGNPVQQETSWRSSLLAAVPGLLLVDGEQTGALPPARAPGGPPEDSFQALCQAQQQQLLCLQNTQHTEISSASSLLEAQLLSGCHSEAFFRLAEEQRYAHEYGDTSITHTQSVETHHLDVHSPVPCSPAGAGEATPGVEHSVHIPSPPQRRQAQLVGDQLSSWPPGPHGPGSACCPARMPAASGGPDLGRTEQRPSHSLPQCSPCSGHAKLDLRSMAAVVIQKHWRGYQCRMRKCLRESSKAHGRCSPSGVSSSGMALLKPSDRDQAATIIQAVWRGRALRSRLALALAAADTGLGDEGLEEVNVDQFVFDEEAVERDWTELHSDGVSPLRGLPEAAAAALPAVLSERHTLPKPALPPAVHHNRNPVLLWKPKQAWSGSEVPSPPEASIPHDSHSSRSSASIVRQDCISARSEKILEEWGITDSHTAYLMLKRAQRMKSRKQQQRKLQDPTVRLALFRNHAARPVPAPAPGRAHLEPRDAVKAQHPEEEHGERQGRRQSGLAYRWTHTQAVGLAPSSPPEPHGPSTCASERFLPEIDPDVLSGGRVQLVAIAGHRDGVCVGAADLSHREPGLARRHSVGYTRKEAPSPQRVTSAPSKKERISFRDKSVQLSGGWGGGKKRARVCK